jgi:signal transduction histidine kinase
MKTPREIRDWLAVLRRWGDERRRERREMVAELMRENAKFHQYLRDHAQLHRRHHGGHSGRYPGAGPDPFWQHHHQEELRQRRQMQARYHQFSRYHRRLRFIRPLILVLNLTIWYLIFRYLGVRIIAVGFAILISVGGIYELFFLRRLEKQVFNPIDQLKKGVEEIARGNYQVRIECDVLNDLTLLVASFNDMAEKLQESEKLKSEYEENRKTMIANISHDLKTPITSIQGYIEALLERGDLSEADRQKYLRIIEYNTAYMNRLIDDLFLFSKLDLDKLEFQFETIAVRDFMADLLGEFRLELEEKQVRLEYEDRLDCECAVWIDRKRIHQAIRNIIGNAVKYGPEQGLAIRAVLCRREDWVRLELRDNGPGIAEDKLPFIFDRFYRIDPERTKDAISTGLGLAIAKELVEAHGGSIAVASAPGAGSCFTIELPALETQGGDGNETDSDYRG